MPSFRKTREGWHCRFQKIPRADGLDKVRGGVHPRFAAGLPFPVPQILEFVAFRDSGKFFQQFSRDFPGVFPEFSRRTPEQTPETATAFSSFLILAGSSKVTCCGFWQKRVQLRGAIENSGVVPHSQEYGFLDHLRDFETTIKMEFAVLRGVGRGGRGENCPKTLFWGGGERHDNRI